MTQAQAQQIVGYLPFLRRYARALTGNQKSGDAYVRATLEAAVAQPDVLARTSSRIGLYKLFHEMWSSLMIDSGEAPAEGWEERRNVDLRLRALVPQHRQVLLLVSLEGFSTQEAGVILGCSADEAQGHFAQAMDELSAGLATEILIIEDEPVIALDLSAIVQELGHKVLPVATTRDEAVAIARDHQPGLILADIQLADDSSGIDAVRDIRTGGPVPVIFITAYPERLLTGERPEPTFLITKPFLADSVKAAVSQALFFNPPPEAVDKAG